MIPLAHHLRANLSWAAHACARALAAPSGELVGGIVSLQADEPGIDEQMKQVDRVAQALLLALRCGRVAQ